MNEKEFDYMLNEILKTKWGYKSLKNSLKIMKKYPFPKIKTPEIINGRGLLKNGLPFRTEEIKKL